MDDNYLNYFDDLHLENLDLLNFDFDDQLVPKDTFDMFGLVDQSSRVTVEPVENPIATQGDLDILTTIINQTPLDDYHVTNSRDDDGYETSSFHSDSCGDSSDQELVHDRFSPDDSVLDELSSGIPREPIDNGPVAILQQITNGTATVNVQDTNGLFPNQENSPGGTQSLFITTSSVLEFDMSSPWWDVNRKKTEMNKGFIPEFHILLSGPDPNVPGVDIACDQLTPSLQLTTTDQSSPTYPLRQVVDDDAVDDEDDDKSIMLDDLKDDDYIPSDDSRRPTVKGRLSKAERRRKETDMLSNRRSRRQTPQLWKFLLNALCDPRLNPSVVVWKDKQKGIFKLKDAKKISHLWGCRIDKERRKPMTYDKFSRAIRYYYKKAIILSYNGRLTYQFGPNAQGWKAAARGSTC